MLSTKLPPYILQELPDITENLNYPLKAAQRVKYTCFDASKLLIVFGATSGGIYIFNRNPCEFVQLIPNKDGAITRLEISPDEKHIAYANGRGTVTVTACSQPLNGNYSTIMSKEHQGNEITAMVWSGNSTIFVGDDVGKISVLQLQSFIAKTMFQTSSQTIMSLDSRICQLDVKECMLLAATLTRCYICDTSQEQYRQIGQKLRDGEFGACFVTDKHVENKSTENTVPDFAEVKKYNIVDDETKFAVNDDLVNTLIYCARPSSRLWEATIDGTVRRTHQYKQFLSKNPMQIFTLESYNNQNICIGNHCNYAEEGRSVNFSKLYHVNKSIFSFKRDALYFLNIEDVENTMWFDYYKDIVECKLYHNILYLWLSNGDVVSLKYMKIEKFLIKCFVDKKYVLCAELCALFNDYLISANLPSSLHILVGLREKMQGEKLKNITDVLKKFDSLKYNEATQMKSGIFVVDNSYRTQASLLDENSDFCDDDGDKAFSNLQPDAMQAFKDLSHTVSDKFCSSKRILKEKWDDFEEKMKHRGHEKQIQEIRPKRLPFEESSSNEFSPVLFDSDIIYKESSQNAIELDNNSSEQYKVCKSLYQYYRLSLVSKESEQSNLISIIESNACDIIQIYNLMLQLEQFCISVGALEDSKHAPNSLFLCYLNISEQKESLLNSIIESEVLYKYFVDSCISVNIKTQNLTSIGCECGYPLPFTTTNQTPVFSELIDEFLEKQWLSLSESQCYEICRKMPCLWKKILYLRRNEDLLNVLRLLLQMLDENLLHSFLPQFTLDTWDRAVQLYATLHANMCLNCNKKFNHISVKDMLNWDDLGALIVKSVGARNALKIMEKHAHLIDPGELTIKFYHTCLLVSMYEKYDATITNQLIDTVYDCFDFENARVEICKLLRSTPNGIAKNTALPVIVAAQSPHWGLCVLNERISPIVNKEILEKNINHNKNISFDEIINNIFEINNCITDCLLCGLPLQNEVLISDGGLWVFKCGHTFHGACLELNKVKLCPSCSAIVQ